MVKQIQTAMVISILLSVPVLAAETPEMSGMHEHMQKMRETMAAMRNENDPEKRGELMARHHDEMQQGMRMMEGGTEGMAMEQRMDAMEERMGMMRMMMEQMMEHEAAAPVAPDAAEHTEHNH